MEKKIVLFTVFLSIFIKGNNVDFKEYFDFRETPPIVVTNVITNENKNIIYVGNDFKSKKKLKWNIKKINDGEGSLTFENDLFSVTRADITDKSTAYEVSLSDAKENNISFLFKVLTNPLKVMAWNIWGREGYKSNEQPIEPSGGEFNFKFAYKFNGKTTG